MSCINQTKYVYKFLIIFCSATSIYINYITLVIKETDASGLMYNGDPIDESIFSTVEGSDTYIGKNKIGLLIKLICTSLTQNVLDRRFTLVIFW